MKLFGEIAGSLLGKVVDKGGDIIGKHMENKDNIEKIKVEGDINKEIKKLDNAKEIKMIKKN